MTRLSLRTRKRKQRRHTLISTWWNQVNTTIFWFVISMYMLLVKHEMGKPRIKNFSSKTMFRNSILKRYVYESDTLSISQIRITRSYFIKLCDMLETIGGLKASRHMDIDEQVVIFLHIIAHNIKNRNIVCNFYRSGETISKYFSRVCNAVIRLHYLLLKKPVPVPENSTDEKWKWFKHCLGALDGTYITCIVPLDEKPRYRTRKGEIATNVLGVCSQDMQFIFVLPGWEWSAAEEMKFDVDMKKKTSQLTFELEKIPSLSQMERFKAIRKMQRDPDVVMTFWNLKEEEREDWVRFVMSE